MDELKRVVQAALKAFYREDEPMPPPNLVGNTGFTELFSRVCSRDDLPHAWHFHDMNSRAPWHVQCDFIAQRCGPTQHSIVLMALAWLTYDGWVRYLQEHKHAPVNVQQYLLDGMQADDIRSVLAKEY